MDKLDKLISDALDDEDREILETKLAASKACPTLRSAYSEAESAGSIS